MSAPEDLKAVLERIPYARFLGVRTELAGDEMTAVLPFSEHLIGNPTLPAIHGGVLGAFMEMTALAQLSIAEREKAGEHRRQPKPIGITVEYLRSGRPVTTYARATVRKLGRRVASVHVEAWQDVRASPVATLTGRFLVSPEG
jgi:uncharacterized protein (TIGR00369 family)